MDDTERQFRDANNAIERAVAAFMIKIDAMSGKWDAVAQAYIVERTVPVLCDELAKLVDRHLVNNMNPAMLKLSNALADYRDARLDDRI
jgi:hypothetical protein